MPLLCHAVALGKKQITSVAVRDSGVALRHGVPLPALLLSPFCFRAGLTIVPRSLLLNRTKTLATRAMADRESSVALCHGLALKKKGSVEDRESGGALCHGVALKKKKRERQRSVADRESGVALCHGVALKKKKKKKKKRAREIGRGPSDQYRSVPRGGVKKRIGRGPRAVSLYATGWR